MNFFEFARIAKGYAMDRPYYHPLVIDMIRNKIGLREKIDKALDVGCGAGLSTVALCEISNDVTGLDGSEEMIKVANNNNNNNIEYILSNAEELPFENDSFDMITVSGSINWIDRSKFLPEALRVLKKDGWLIVYDNTITDTMIESEKYNEWYYGQYLDKYPKPPRDETPFTKDESKRYGFKLFDSVDYTNIVPMSCEEYINFIVTQSNVIASVDMEGGSLSSSKEWFFKTLDPIIPKPKGSFQFGGYIWFLKVNG